MDLDISLGQLSSDQIHKVKSFSNLLYENKLQGRYLSSSLKLLVKCLTALLNY